MELSNTDEFLMGLRRGDEARHHSGITGVGAMRGEYSIEEKVIFFFICL